MTVTPGPGPRPSGVSLLPVIVLFCDFSLVNYADGKGRQSKRGEHHPTLVQNRKKHKINSHPIIHCPTSEEVSEVSEQANE